LALALSRLPEINDPRVIVGSNTADDACVFQISPDRALVHTVDIFAPVVDDAYTFGRIAAINSLSDIYAMGGKPLSAMNVLGIPCSIESEVISDILRGGQDVIVDAGAAMLGGHTFQDSEVKYGLAVTGVISPDRIYTNCGANPGDVLVLTKRLGTGTIIQAMITRGVIPDAVYKMVVDSMLSSNRRASELMQKYETSACTDITGFGFLGHAWEMAEASKVGMTVYCDKLPIFPLAMDLIREGVVDAGVKMNRNSFEKMIDFGADVPLEYQSLMYNSETSGGLLITLPADQAGELVDALMKEGCDSATIIGEVIEGNPGRIIVEM
jgi:selenide,water dikinase